MKAFITPAYVFDPALKTVDLSAISGFDIKRLVAIINQTDGILIYSTANTALKYTAEAAGVVTLNYDTTSMDAGDKLQVIYEIPDYIGTASDVFQDDYNGNGSLIALVKGLMALINDGVIANQDSDSAVQASIKNALEAMNLQLPVSRGAKTGANSLSIVPASDAVFNVNQKAQTGSFDEDLTVSTTAETFTAPAGAFACFVSADDTNSTNLRVKMNGTASTTSGTQFQPGRSEYFEGGSNISYCTESGSGKISVQWFIRS